MQLLIFQGATIYFFLLTDLSLSHIKYAFN